MKFAPFIFLLNLFTFHVQATDSMYFGIHHQFEDTRALGMGGAFTAVANDNTAIFYNPAGLSQLQEGESNWFIKADVDPEVLDFYDQIDKAGKETDKVQGIGNVIQDNYGKTFSFRAPSVGWLWARPNWGLAVIPADVSLNMYLDRSVGPSINLFAIQDTTIAFAQSWKIRKWHKAGSFNVGVTTKLIYRVNVDEVVDIASISLNDKILKSDSAKEGMTLDADIGFLWKGPWQSYNPSASMVIRNIGDYGYFANMKMVGKGTAQPERLHRVIDFGYAMDLPSWWVWTSKVAFDVRDILHPNWNLQKGFHLGAEFMWQVASWFRGGWRGGLNQGYWTAGFTGEFGVFRLDLASYGEEVGVQDERRENRRYMMTMSLDF